MTFADSNKQTFGHWHRDIVGTDPHTLEDMREHLERFPEIEYVSMPNTWVGYGSTLATVSNYAALSTQYQDTLHYFGTELFMHREEFFTDESELAELHFYLKNDYMLYDESDYSEREYETIFEYVADSVCYELEISRDEFADLVTKTELHVYDWCVIDNDGATPYMSESALKTLCELVKEVM